jgi:hypothetical protein
VSPRRSARLTGFALLLIALAGCDDLGEFKTQPNEVFRGEVIGSDADPDMESFIRKGFVSHTLLELSFDPNASAGSSDAGMAMAVTAGVVDSYVCPDGASSCDEGLRTNGVFVHAPLINIPGLAHDPLSQYDFPGGGRLRNYILGARFTSQAEGEARGTGRDATLFVSLMENGRMEVRAMAPPLLESDGMTERWPALFGVFQLSRKAR